VFEEKASGAQRERPALQAALEYMRQGDTLVVWKLDRLARSLKQLIETVEEFGTRGIGLRSLTEAIDTTTAGGKLVFHIFAALAEFERGVIRERTMAGLQAARARGRTGGRPPALKAKDLAAAKALLQDPEITVLEVARRRPQYSFVLIGPVTLDRIGGLKNLSNVHLLGEKPYRELPGYLRHFAVCTLPFRMNKLTRSVDPVKVYEYLSQGKPVVSTPLPDLFPISGLLYFAEGPEEFARQIDRALEAGVCCPLRCHLRRRWGDGCVDCTVASRGQGLSASRENEPSRGDPLSHPNASPQSRPAWVPSGGSSLA
jgi:hypothetical protein